MATMQVAPQHAESSVGQGTYPVTPSSRRQYAQQTPQSDEQGRGTNARSPQSSSREASRKRSGNGATITVSESPRQPFHQSPAASHHSASTTPRGRETTEAAERPMAPVTVSSTTSPQQVRRDQRVQMPQHEGPPISPPPRTSSSQRNPVTNPILPSNAELVDRTVNPRQVSQLESGDSEFNDSAAAAANAARSRRRGPTSPEGPQRAISTREPSHHQPPPAVQTRSASHMPTGTLPSRSARDEGQVINRVVVDDPAIDIRREQERQLESVPGLATVNDATMEDITKAPLRSRQDHSASSASGGRRKDARFGEYILGQTLGEGEFGKVKLGWKKGGEVQVAIKLIRRETLGQNPSRLPKIYREVSILRGLEHPNIVKLHEMIETTPYIGIILEYASGGELFDYILNHRYLKDNVARKLFAQLVSGVGYLHKKGIVHRDLKLENLLLDRNRNIVITDFGFANTFNPNDELDEEIEHNLTDRNFVKGMGLDRIKDGVRRGDLMATSCGSPCYAAPELVVTDSLYTGRKVDVWSCGVILYAMLAGYLPFDDDPANPDGDNINLLYKYITNTPLTFPEYVTPHARDLLRRILVPDPRKRADLWEVARHSWLLDYQHVVKGVTSSTTTMGDIQHAATRSADQPEAPLLVRSASVREPPKAHPTNLSTPGALAHQGNLDPEQAIDKSRAQRDTKRRTVQVEYVAPQKQTTRGEPLPVASSSTVPANTSALAGQSKTRVRGITEGPQGVPSNYTTSPSTSKPLPQDPSVATGSRSQAYQTSSRKPQAMAPPLRPPKDIPRSVSDSTSAFGQLPSPTITRPTTGGSMASSGPGRLPSRGNSYSQPLAPTVATTNAQARLSQPKNGKQYNISAPIPQAEPFSQAESIGRPSTQQHNPPAQGPSQDQSRGHKRSNTLGNFFRTGSISGGRSQTSSPGDARKEKRYPPTSMKAPVAADSPRQSFDSRTPSFSFSRKNSKTRMDSDQATQEKPRRFSLLPASFSLRNFTGMGSSKEPTPDQRPSSERRQSSGLMQGPSSRAQSRPQTMSYSKSPIDFDGSRQESIPPPAFDGQRDRRRDNVSQQVRRKDVPSREGQQNQYSSSQYHSQLDPYVASRPPQPGQSYLGTPTESEISLNPRGERPMYPQGFNSYEDGQPRPSMQQTRGGRPGVLQKNNRKFGEAYNQNPDGIGGQHSGTSGAAKRVMDFFRRRGKARAGEEKL